MSKRDSDDVRRASQIGAVQRSQETAGCTHVCRNAADVIVEHIAHQETRNACVKPPVPASPPGRSSRAGALSRPGHHVSVVDRRRVRDQRQPPRHQHRPGAVHTARRLRAWQQPVKHAAHVARALRHRGNVLLTTPLRRTPTGPTRPPNSRTARPVDPVDAAVDGRDHRRIGRDQRASQQSRVNSAPGKSTMGKSSIGFSA